MTRALTTPERLRSMRSTANLKQSDVAKATGISQEQISRYESGSSKPNAATYDRLVDFYRNASSAVREQDDAYNGVLGIQGRSQGKLSPVRDLMAPPVVKEWLVSNFLARRYVTVFAGQEGAGKSMLAQTIAKALACGEPEAFGFRLPGNVHRTLIVDVENVNMIDTEHVDGSDVGERLQAFGLDEESAHNITVVGCDDFDLSQDMDVLDGILTDAEKDGRPYSLLVLDSFRSLWVSGSENTPEAGRVVGRLKKMAHAHNVAILLLHHTNKAGAAYSGHTSIGSQASGGVWTFSKLVHKNELTGKKDGHPTLRYIGAYKNRIAPEAKGRIVSVSGQGIVSAKSADEYEAEGFVIDPGTPDDTDETGE